MLSVFAKLIVLLPLHDSFIVATGNAAVAVVVVVFVIIILLLLGHPSLDREISGVSCTVPLPI